MSNAVIIRGQLSMLPATIVNAGVSVSNFLTDGEPRFKHHGIFKKGVTHFVLHETGGNTAEGAATKFSRGDVAAHLILDPLGHITCHADLATDILYHAGYLNGCSIGMEVVNPYNPLYDRLPMEPTIPAQWWTWVPSMKSADVRTAAAKRGWTSIPRVYCLPTAAQVAAVKAFVPWLCAQLDIPFVFPTRDLGPQKRKFPGWEKKVLPPPGILAHYDVSGHSDGRYLLEQLWT